MFKEIPAKKVVKKPIKTVKIKSEFKTIKQTSTYVLSDNEVNIGVTVKKNGRISLLTTFGKKEFIFKNSTAKMIERVGRLIVESSKLKI